MTPDQVLEAIRKANNLPSLPHVAVEVIRLTNEDVSVGEIAKVIEQDPALTIKLLKLVNSSLFGMPREIASLPQAMVVLGLRTVKTMALSFSLVDSLSIGQDDTFDLSAFWRRSLTTAVAGRLLADATVKAKRDEAFVAGLLTDIGLLAASHCIPDIYEDVFQRLADNDGPIQNIEQEILGITHAQIGAELLSSWGLPSSLMNAVANHHGLPSEHDDEIEGDPSLVPLTRAAALLADLFCQDVPSHQLLDTKSQVADVLDMDEDDLEDTLTNLSAHVKDAAKLFSVEVGEMIDYDQLKTQAMLKLAELSMAAEIDRSQADKKAQLLQNQNKDLLEVASTDSLTNVANRAAFEKRLALELDRAAAAGETLGLIMLDIDKFKRLNDTHGHQAGDAALQLVGATLRNAQDPNTFVARYGGEEFVIVAAKSSADQLKELAEQVRSAIENLQLNYEGKCLAFTASFGGAAIQPAKTSVTGKDIIQIADKNLYASKEGGRNRSTIT
jgi:diguanylate cyclase (GGDEF)-like protein